MERLKFKWTVSRGRDTYGYNICSLWVDGKKVSSCNGGGYDMKGTALANWMQEKFQDEIDKIKDRQNYYGLKRYEGKYLLDGACGFDSIKRILNAIGYKLIFADETPNSSTYLMDTIPTEATA